MEKENLEYDQINNVYSEEEMNKLIESGMGRECQKCSKEITLEDIQKNNGPVRIVNLPGFFHKRCKAQVDIDIVSTGRVDQIFPKEGGNL